MIELTTNTEPVAVRDGIEIKHFFSTPSCSPYDQIEWDTRDCIIANEHGKTVFEQRGVEVPRFWSQMAANVVASKYFRGEMGTPARESSVRALIDRVVITITSWGEADGYFASSADASNFKFELTYLLLHQYASFNSPVWFNVGVTEHPQCSACFIVSVDDTIESLLELQTIEARLFKYGSGTGSNLSSIRSSRERLSGGGVPSGPVSFMRGFDAWAGIIKSGGKTRRAAKMQILNASHPDIREFIRSKSDEEEKAWALMEQGYDGGFAVPGGAYESVAFQNANLSVRATDEFMQAAEKNGTYTTRRVIDGKPYEELRAREILDLIAKGTHLCGDPGMQFDTTINEWHTCPNSGRINASNPCSEYMHLDNSACNLSSLNLLRFLDSDGNFNTEAFQQAVHIMVIAQDILIDRSSYPTKKIEASARTFRQLGLGYANLGALLMNLGLPYDSVEGNSLAAGITALLTGQAYLSSSKLAAVKGPFAGFKKNRVPMLKVVQKHHAALEHVRSSSPIAQEILGAARVVWDAAREYGKQQGFRNAQATVLAPTGTISFMMDCDTTGVEPDIALVKYKKLVGGGALKLVNGSVPRALRVLGYGEDEIKPIIDYIAAHDCIEGAPGLRAEHLPVFDCAFKASKGVRAISPQGHLNMMAAVQPFLSGAISKTVNLPHETTVEEIAGVYMDAWKKGIKSVALYRDGSKRTQPLTTKIDKESKAVGSPVRRRLADERHAITHKFQVGGLEGYLTVGLFEDGSPGEVFLVVAKEGSTLSGVMDAFATSVSMALQYGVPLAALVKKFSYMRFDPSGFTGNRAIPTAYSVIDYVFRWLGHKFLSPTEIANLGLTPLRGGTTSPPKPLIVEFAPDKSENGGAHQGADKAALLFKNSDDAPPCTNCGSNFMVRQAGCYVCLNCGAQGGCG
ncbi:MAG: vitamin B12-dependent ribonucleotide reductase [Deltaproteobacteria bacterium]|nr:vitamin B12-dependent ribonucleotide reductase [Deltaproteobacteria bacterium]